jgi:site-specific DNA recombinase
MIVRRKRRHGFKFYGNPTLLREVLRQIGEHRNRTSAGIRREKADAERDIRRAAQEIKEAVSTPGNVGTARLADLQDQMSQQNNRFADLSRQLAAIDAEDVDAQDVEKALHAFDPLWEQLSTWEQERFIRALVERIDYNGKTGTVTLGFRSRGIRDICNWAPINEGDTRTCRTAQLK